MMAHVGLVCEGDTDIIALKAFVSAFLANRGIRDVTFQCLQPNADASSRAPGGWARVVGWCRKFSGDALQRLFTIPGFDGERLITHLVIHIDGDALDLVAGACDKREVALDAGHIPDTLRRLIVEELNCAPGLESRLVLAVPVQSTEAWILAALVDEELDFDSIDAKSEYRRRYVNGRRGTAREKFGSAARKAANEQQRAASRSASFAYFLNEQLPKLAA